MVCGRKTKGQKEQSKASGQRKIDGKQHRPRAFPPHSETEQQKEKQAAIRREKAAVRRLEQEIAETEAEIFTLESSLSAPDIASDYQKITELSEQLQALRQKNDALFTEWSTRTEQLETTHSLGSL